MPKTISKQTKNLMLDIDKAERCKSPEIPSGGE
jgi:hypothetical protein